MLATSSKMILANIIIFTWNVSLSSGLIYKTLPKFSVCLNTLLTIMGSLSVSLFFKEKKKKQWYLQCPCHCHRSWCSLATCKKFIDQNFRTRWTSACACGSLVLYFIHCLCKDVGILQPGGHTWEKSTGLYCFLISIQWLLSSLGLGFHAISKTLF